MKVSLVVAMSPERVIGRDNDLPWHWPEDLKHFKASTRGGTVVMGRRSFESLGGKALPKRTNLVVSRSRGADAGPDGREEDGVRVFGSLTDACAWVARERPGDTDHCWILGGSSLFRESLAPLDDGVDAFGQLELPVPRTLVVTWVPSVPVEEGDVLFPFDEAWIERHYDAAEHRRGETGELEFVTYVLRDGAGA